MGRVRWDGKGGMGREGWEGGEGRNGMGRDGNMIYVNVREKMNNFCTVNLILKFYETYF